MLTSRPLPIQIPLSSLFPPSSSEAGPSQPIPSPSFLVGPLPPTAPLHIALAYLKLADLPPYEGNGSPRTDHSLHAQGRGKGKEKEHQHGDPLEEEDQFRSPRRVLVITGSKASFGESVEEDDEDWMRGHGGDYEVLRRLRRVDMRYCPTSAHLKLLLTLLSETTDRKSHSNEPHLLSQTPSVVILWDVAALFMYDEEVDENEPPKEELDLEEERREVELARLARIGKRFKSGTTISDYLDVLSATRAMVDHLSSLHPAEAPIQLVILEPNVASSSDLPIIPAAAEGEATKLSKVNREKRIPILDGARWLFGNKAVGVIEPYSSIEEGPTTRYSLMLDSCPGEVFQIRRQRCGRGEWAVPEVEEDTVIEGLKGGWRWEWT
ncbi:hypothetical protein CI109_101770 [Kwoniella shandongensis]|uniref:Uncharacterized protein n=1 Tax=Kwoniella shandongensis TaxID=1734106 RepID=A0A5M6C583_9TREE|nr:uncharacterized protein CI109_001108 [Kwoniella shandongensis]KAA5530307.1 hypothetical protein CI109_001108 [Kwoniella shandongensis]